MIRLIRFLRVSHFLFSSFILIVARTNAADAEIHDQVEHGYAKNGDVTIHYASLGQGPLMIMIHGFPDYWYTWRKQMSGLSPHYRTVAMDQRGYNRSSKPKGVAAYDINHLVKDVKKVIESLDEKNAIIVGHDWGGFVAWHFAMQHPDLTKYLIILNLPHPRGLTRELANNPKQQENSAYARGFQQEGAHLTLTAKGLANWVADPSAKERYIAAFERSDFEAMLNYYKCNYPREPYRESTTPVIKVQCPVLIFHGLDDWALLPPGLNDTWEWLEKDLTLVTIPNVGHFVQQDASQRITQTIKSWLNLQENLQE
ncbi:MAG: Epoxide hydrolase B [Verrucomicrobia subdivision 3 bacterium]|nr:Epoxide hydrolase B [Limisphaerales bacterium]MCS1415284.1 Epoxide hydrolase B [Limisphaerales bacterium]